MTLRVLAFTPLPEAGAAGRYRVFQFIEPLRAHGIDLHVQPFFDDAAFARLYTPGGVATKAWDLARLTAGHVARLQRARRFDVALVHRELWPLAGGWPLDVLRSAQSRYVFDLDDAVFLPNVSDANRRFVGLKSHGSVARIASHATLVSAGNAWLADWARGVRSGGSDDDVRVIPTVVDSALWTPSSPADDGSLRLLWIGSPSTARYLAAWGPVLARLAARHRNLELHVIGARLAIEGVNVIVHDWSPEAERAVGQRAHIGLSPLGSGDWESGKCGLKQLLYMGLGLPAVASHAGVHPEIVTDGSDGLLVRDDAALEAALERLLSDAPYRARLGLAARMTLERHYSLRAVAPQLAAVLHRAAERS